jgi:hypothetical protein
MSPLMNNTKWDEIRLAMYGLGTLHPRWRTKGVSGHLSEWDSEWYYHFRAGGYEWIEWLEIQITSPEQNAAVLAALRAVHVPGHRTEDGFRIYGYACSDKVPEYI